MTDYYDYCFGGDNEWEIEKKSGNLSVVKLPVTSKVNRDGVCDDLPRDA